ncbi:MAG TPA: trehalose-6-phosphate synthase [Mycobacteriales bacterium]|nr:trehalose-6-phosphate synthase [Mycobacteriales bacterium]
MSVVGADVLIASNRGPLSFRRDDDTGRLISSRGGGGLVSAMAAAAAAPHTLWLCAALSEPDREAALASPDGRIDQAGHDTAGAAVVMLPIDAGVLTGAYTRISNGTLWSLNHGLAGHVPAFDDEWRRNWSSYVDYNQTFAAAIADHAAAGAHVLVQDYHLDLLPAALRALRPDLRIGHFTHTPWATREDFAQLPEDVAAALLLGVLGADSVGFHSPRWAADFAACAGEVLGATYDDGVVSYQQRQVPLRIHPLGIDAEPLRDRVAQPDVRNAIAGLRKIVGDQRVIARVDRTEPAKNIHRGLLAVAQLFRDHPEHIGKVVHVALAYPSRQNVEEYRNYTAECIALAAEINASLATPEWTPVLFNVRDDYPRSLATLCSGDVLLVNSLRDGMNLVAKEGVVLGADTMLVLSRETGAADEMTAAFLVDPLDVDATADALHQALTTPAAEREQRHAALVAVATALPPRAWLQAQLDALA